MRIRGDYFCAKIVLVTSVTLLALTTVWAEDGPDVLHSTAVRYRGIQFTTPRPQPGGILSNFFLSAAKIFENVQVAAERYLERRRVSDEFRRRGRIPVPPTARMHNVHDAQQLVPQSLQNKNDTDSAVKSSQTATNANNTAATTAPFQPAPAPASTAETQRRPDNFPLPPPQEASGRTEVTVESITKLSSTTSVSESTDIDSSTVTMETPKSKTTRRQVETVNRPSSSSGAQGSGVLGSIVRNVLPGGSISSAASLLNDGRAPSVASTAKPESVQLPENLQNSQEDNAEDNFADLAAIPVFSDGDDGDNLETDDFSFPTSQNDMPANFTSLLPEATQAPSPSSIPIPMMITTRTTDSPVAAEPLTPESVENLGPSDLDSSILKTTTKLPFIPVTLPPAAPASTATYKDLSSSVLIKSARVQASVTGNGQQNLPTLNVSDFQNLKHLLTGLVSSLREGVSDSGKSHVFNINIGTINWNYGQNPHVIYNGNAQPEVSSTTYPASQGTSMAPVNLPANGYSPETRKPAVNIPSRSPAFTNSQPSQSTRVTTRTTPSTTTAYPEIDPRQPPNPGVVFYPKNSNSKSAFQAISLTTNNNGPPVPLPPVDGFDEFEEFSSHEDVAPVTIQPTAVNSTETPVKTTAATEPVAELDLDVRILTGSAEKRKRMKRTIGKAVAYLMNNWNAN